MKSYKLVIDCKVSLDKKTIEELVLLAVNRTKLFLEKKFTSARRISFKKIKQEQYARLELRIITADEIAESALQEFLFANILSKYFSAYSIEAVSVQSWNIYYQPDLKNEEWGVKLYSFQVYNSKAKAHKDFPDKTILAYSKNEIENPTFVD
jgi:hypothetical protein